MMRVHLQVALLSRIHHRNLVPLIGYCEEGHQRVLVYEYMHNGTLRDHIHGLLSCLKVFFASTCLAAIKPVSLNSMMPFLDRLC